MRAAGTRGRGRLPGDGGLHAQPPLRSPRHDEREAPLRRGGPWLGSSFLFATARDFARFGLLYLRDGTWDGRRILPHAWVDHARTPTSASGGFYGAHWWLPRPGIFAAGGFRGQYIVVAPSRDLVVVRLGATSRRRRPRLEQALSELVACFPETDAQSHGAEP